MIVICNSSFSSLALPSQWDRAKMRRTGCGNESPQRHCTKLQCFQNKLHPLLLLLYLVTYSVSYLVAPFNSRIQLYLNRGRLGPSIKSAGARPWVQERGWTWKYLKPSRKFSKHFCKHLAGANPPPSSRQLASGEAKSFEYPLGCGCMGRNVTWGVV